MPTEHQQQLSRINNTFELRRTQINGEEPSRVQQILIVCLPRLPTDEETKNLEKLIKASQPVGFDYDSILFSGVVVAMTALLMVPRIIKAFRSDAPALDCEQMESIAKKAVVAWHRPEWFSTTD